MFSSEYWYIGLLTLLLLTMQVFAILYLARHKWTSRITLWILAAFILAMQIVDLAKGNFYIAFSTIAFWLFILGVIIPWRPFKVVSVYFCMLAGGMYTAGFLLRPELMTHMGPFGIHYMSGFLTHDILVVGALIMLSQFKIKKYDLAVIGGVFVIAVVFAELSAHVFHLNGVNGFFVGMIEGTVFKDELFHDMQLTWWWYILWYVFMLALLWGLWELIRFTNKRLLKYDNVMKGKLVW